MTADMNQKPDELDILYQITTALNRHRDLKRSLFAVLEILSENMNMVRGMITLVNPFREEIRIEVAHGLSKRAVKKAKYKFGEGITGRVIQTGNAITVPDIWKSNQFLNRTGSRDAQKTGKIAFICVPIKKDREVIGTLGVDMPNDGSYALSAGEKFLSVVAKMIATQVIFLEWAQREREKLKAENERLQSALEKKYRINNIVGNSNKMREVFQMISQVAGSNATVLIRGESGTGKELVANAIHYNSKRANKPFIKVNCAALPENLIESELFGHEKGAFTGALSKKPGKFEMATGGTIFLDEIGAINTNVQTKLLRVLQEMEFERLGGNKTIKVNVRVITATNKNLEQAVAEGSFRSDLYYRINVFPIYLPPLRERKTDVLMLADFFLEKYARENGKDIVRFSTPAIDMLMSYHWPGNVRELENCIERAVLLCEGRVINSYHLPPTLQTGRESGTLPSQSLEEAVANLEHEMIVDALKNSRGNMAQAAKLLNTTVRKISYKAAKYGIDPRQYR